MLAKKVVLTQNGVTLKQLSSEHFIHLTALAEEKKIWEHAPDAYYFPAIFREKWLDKAIKQVNEGNRACFVIFYHDQAIGSSSYYKIDNENKKMDIGYTWIHPSFWGTQINAIVKLLLLEYAFAEKKTNRVEFSVDSINSRSCRALEKLGIQKEGILRNYLILPNGRIRHSAIYSVILEEWPEVKQHIEQIISSGLTST